LAYAFECGIELQDKFVMALNKNLLSAQEAAGYAMATPDEDSEAREARVVRWSLDEALRHGHLSAARTPGSNGLVFQKSVTEPAKSMLRGVVGSWWNGKAPA
jgi:hypothetical protein